MTLSVTDIFYILIMDTFQAVITYALPQSFFCHFLYKAEAAPIIKILCMLTCILRQRRHIRIGMVYVKIFDDMKSTLIDIKMDVSFLKIWCEKLPYHSLRESLLDCSPCVKSQTLIQIFLEDEEQVRLVLMCFLVDFEYRAANWKTTPHDFIYPAVRLTVSVLQLFWRWTAAKVTLPTVFFSCC